MVKSTALLMDAIAVAANAEVVAAVAVEAEADAEGKIVMMVDQISLPRQRMIVGIILNRTTAGRTTPTIRLIATRKIESRRQNLRIVPDARAVAVVAEVEVEVEVAIEMRDNGTAKKSPTAVVMDEAMSQIVPAETADLVEVAVADRAVVKTTPAMSGLLAQRATIALDAAEVIDQNVTSILNARGVVVAAAAHADQMIRYREFHDTATYRLGTMRSRESSHPTSKATVVDPVVDPVAALKEDGDDRIHLAVVAVETLDLVDQEVITPVQIEVMAATTVLTEAATQALGVETPVAIAARRNL